MAAELRQWSRVNEREGRAEACCIAPCQSRPYQLAVGEVAVPWFLSSPAGLGPFLGLAPTHLPGLAGLPRFLAD